MLESLNYSFRNPKKT